MGPPNPVLRVLGLVAIAAIPSSATLPGPDDQAPPVATCWIEGRVVHDEDGAPVRKFRLFLFGNGLGAETVDGSDYPSMKKGWRCSPLETLALEQGRIEPDTRLSAEQWSPAEEDPDSTATRAPSKDRRPEDYRFRREVVGGSGRFEWRIQADGCDPAWGHVDLREQESARIGEVRLRRASAIVEGGVYDLEGLPVEGAKVELSGLVRSRRKGELSRDVVLTDSRGSYRFEGVPAGRGFVCVHPGPARPMPSRKFDVLRGEAIRAEFRPVVGSLLLRVETAEGEEWRRPFEICLGDPDGWTSFRWTTLPPRPERGEVSGLSSLGPGWACAALGEALELEPLERKGVPPWEPYPARVDGMGEGGDVVPGEDGRSATIRNVPVGEWSIAVYGARRAAPDLANPAVSGKWDWHEAWDAPALEPSPETVTVREGERSELVLRAK